MTAQTREGSKILLDLEKVNSLNSEGCAACGRKFSLGEMAVLACGAWNGGPKYIHENEAVFDRKTNTFIEKKCYMAQRGR